MPTYGYQCTQCSYEFSVFQSMKDEPVKTCPECSGDVKRLLYPVGIVFKGSGWYVNDSRGPEKKEKSETAAASPAPAAESSTTPAPSTTDAKNSSPAKP
jgi:putative FmdB family regulatory protein